MGRWSKGEGLTKVQAEIEKEKAEALGRAGERLDGAIRALRLIRDEVGGPRERAGYAGRSRGGR